MSKKKSKNPFGNCQECNKKDFSNIEYDHRELTEEEKEVIKWRRRWALEEIKEKTRDTANPYHSFYETLYEKLEPLHMLTDPEIKEYLIEKEMKSKQPPKPSEVLLKPEQVKVKPLPEKSRSFCLEKVFKPDNDPEKAKSHALLQFNPNIAKDISRIEEMDIQGKSLESAYKEHFDKILPMLEEVKQGQKTLEDLNLEQFFTKGPLADDYNKTVNEAEDFLKKGEELIEKINEKMKMKKNRQL